MRIDEFSHYLKIIVHISDHLKGIILTTLGVTILSPDALLMRLLHAETWTIVFWRGVAFATGIFILMMIIYREKTIEQFVKIGKGGLLIGLIFGGSTLCFTTAIQNTSIANTLVLISTSPMFAALLSWFFLGEKIKLRTWVAMIVILGAIAAIVSQSFQAGSLFGDLCALGSSIFMAISFTIMRRFKDVNMVPAMGLSGLLVALISIPVIYGIDGTFKLDSEVVPYLIMMGFVITIAFALITIGPRYLSAPEVSLIMPLEIVLGSYLGWIFLSEEPNFLTIIGGIIVILTLTVHSCLSLKESK